MDHWMNRAWYRRETLKDLKAMTYREIRLVGKWALELEGAERLRGDQNEADHG